MRQNLDITIALAYAPLKSREVIETLFDLDDVMIRLIRGTREPLLGQIKIQWWVDQFKLLKSGIAAAPHPLLQRFSACDLSERTLEKLIIYCENWNLFISPPPYTHEELLEFSGVRTSLIDITNEVVGVKEAHEHDMRFKIWCLLDVAKSLGLNTIEEQCQTLAHQIQNEQRKTNFNSALRSFSILGSFAEYDLKNPTKIPRHGSPKRMWQALSHVLFKK
jgi:15-cis-phytoene synthase